MLSSRRSLRAPSKVARPAVRRRALLLLLIVAAALLVLAGAILRDVHHLTRPVQRALCCRTPADLGLRYEEVTFAGGDGTRLSGWYLPSRNGAAVIMLHGNEASRVQLLDHAAAMARQGYGVLLYDLRGHGQSGGDRRSWGWLDVADVPGALAYLVQRPEVDAERIGIYGASLGGQIALRAAAADERLRAVATEGAARALVADEPPAETIFQQATRGTYAWAVERAMQWRLGVAPPTGLRATLGQLAPRPVLLIATGSPGEQRRVQHFFALAGEPKMYWEIPEAAHGEGFQARPEAYAERLAALFDQALLAPGGP